MNNPFATAKKYLEPTADKYADPTEGRIVAVEICSNILEAHIWLAFDKDFNPHDGQAVFFADELPLLKNKGVETLKEIHKVKAGVSGLSGDSGRGGRPRVKR